MPMGQRSSTTTRNTRRASLGAFTVAALLVVLSLASLDLVSAVDDAAYGFVMRNAGGGPHLREWLAWLLQARIASAIVCLLLYVGTARIVQRDVPPVYVAWRRPAFVASAWLIGTVIAIHGFGVYVPPLPRTVDVAAFLGFGLLAEELLFRGAIFAVAAHVFPSRRALPIVLTAVLFSLQHLQYYRFHAGTQALTQVAYTLPLGLVLGYVRAATGRLLPGIGLHVLNNAIAVL